MLFSLFTRKKPAAVAAPRPRPTLNGSRQADRIALVGFHDKGFVIALPAEAHAPWLQERAVQLHKRLGGCTNLADGLAKGIDLLERTPRPYLRRIWLLSDGEPNVGVDRIWPTVARAKGAYINVNTIGFGDSFDGALLRRIATGTHNGKFVSVQTLRELTKALVAYADPKGSRGPRRPETTALVIDLSGSMGGSMEGKSKVQVVEEAILHLLTYKQRMWS